MKNIQDIKQEIKENKDKYYTYGLYRNDGTIFYVGIGTKQRIFSHFSSTRKDGNLLKKNIIEKENGNTSAKILRWFSTKEEAARLEIQLITYFGRRDIGTGILSNMTAGGEGQAEPSQESREATSQRFKGKKRCREVVEKYQKSFFDKSSVVVHNKEYNLSFRSYAIACNFIEMITHREITPEMIRYSIRTGKPSFETHWENHNIEQHNCPIIGKEENLLKVTDMFHVSSDAHRPVVCQELDEVFNDSFHAIKELVSIGVDIGYTSNSNAAYNIVRCAKGLRATAFGGFSWKFYDAQEEML